MFEVILSAVLPGLALGVLVGATAQFTTFCSVGAVADIVLAKDWRRARSWMMAGAVALLGTQIATAEGLIPIYRSVYRAPFANPLMATIGSLAFGYGMAMAGGCLQRALVRIGGGSLKSLATVAIMGATGLLTTHFMNVSGIWAATAWPTETPSSLHGIVAALLGVNPLTTESAITLIIVAVLLVFCLKDSWFRESPGHLWGGAAIGVAVALAWVDWSRTDRDLPRGMNLFADLIYSAHAFMPSQDRKSVV